MVGQPQVTEPLIKSLEAGKVGHAYLFVGPRGCGKTSVARILAHEINGFEYKLEDEYVDIIEIDGASNRGIENIRELREKVAIAPTVGKYKVYIIDEVHMLTKEAFNALLKTLEEPPAHVVFIMATTDAHKVPVTITSRAQTYTFKLAEPTMMLEHLKGITKKEGIKIDDEALKVLVKRGGGSFRDSLSLLDQLSSLSSDMITKEMVIKAMGLPDDEKIDALLAEYISGDVNKLSLLLKELLSTGAKAETIAEEIIARIIEAPKAELLPLLAKLPDVKAPYAEAKLLTILCLKVTESISSGARLEFSSTSYAGPRTEPPRRGEPVRAVRNIGVENSNQGFMHQKEIDSVVAPGPVSAFDWQGFLEKVQEMNDAVYLQLMKCDYEFKNGELRLYPQRKIVQNILSKDNNKRILVDAAGGVKITLCDKNDPSRKVAEDETLQKISAIMGGEVRNDGGTSPF